MYKTGKPSRVRESLDIKHFLPNEGIEPLVPDESNQTFLMSDNSKRCFGISIAGYTLQVETFYVNTFRMCSGYLYDLRDQMPDIRISITMDDIEYERKEAMSANLRRDDGYLETLAVYRQISEAMLDYDTFLMHGAVIAVENRGFMFTAESGTGKTTHIRKWLQNLEKSYVVNGDKPLIKITEDQILACGTPWCGKERMGTNTMVDLKAIVLMERAIDNSINEISYNEAFTLLLQQTYRPNGTEKVFKTLRLISRLKEKVHFYRFRFNNMKDDTFSVAYNVLCSLS